MEICREYKNGNCQILKQKIILSSKIVEDGVTYTGSVCQEYEGKRLCGWYPISRQLTPLQTFIEDRCKNTCGNYVTEPEGIKCIHYDKIVDEEVMAKCKELTRQIGELFT